MTPHTTFSWKCCHVRNLFNGALLVTLLWDQAHNFTDLLHDLSSQSSSASRRLDATPKIIILAYINQFLSRFVDILENHTGNLHNGLRSQNCGTSTSCSKLYPRQSFSELSAPAWWIFDCPLFGAPLWHARSASTCCARITRVSLPPRVTRGDLPELQSPSQRIRSHVSNSVTAKNLSSTFVTTSFTPSWRHSLWPCSGCSS